MGTQNTKHYNPTTVPCWGVCFSLKNDIIPHFQTNTQKGAIDGCCVGGAINCETCKVYAINTANAYGTVSNIDWVCPESSSENVNFVTLPKINKSTNYLLNIIMFLIGIFLGSALFIVCKKI